MLAQGYIVECRLSGPWLTGHFDHPNFSPQYLFCHEFWLVAKMIHGTCTETVYLVDFLTFEPHCIFVAYEMYCFCCVFLFHTKCMKCTVLKQCNEHWIPTCRVWSDHLMFFSVAHRQFKSVRRNPNFNLLLSLCNFIDIHIFNDLDSWSGSKNY